MCDFGKVERISLVGSGKVDPGWFQLREAQVYHDHFINAPINEGVVIDIFNPDPGKQVSLCLELEASSAIQLAGAILSTVEGINAKSVLRRRVNH